MDEIVTNALRKVAMDHGISESEVKTQIEEAYGLASKKCEEDGVCSAGDIVLHLAKLVMRRRNV